MTAHDCQVFHPSRTEPARRERQRLMRLYNTATALGDTRTADALLEQDSELFDVVIAEDGTDDVTWR